MKSLITRFVSIGAIFSLLLVGWTARTRAQLFGDPSVHIHKGAVALFAPSINSVLAKVTAHCTGGTGSVAVRITQTAAQSNADTPASGTGSSTVKCDGQDRDVAVSTGVFQANLGEATAMVTLTPPSGTPVTATRTINIAFPVLENMEEEQGGNPEE
jgi:hypothetical protein